MATEPRFDGHGNVAFGALVLGENAVGCGALRRGGRAPAHGDGDAALVLVPCPDGVGAFAFRRDGAAGHGDGDVALARPRDDRAVALPFRALGLRNRDPAALFRGRGLPDMGQNAVGSLARRRDGASRRVDGDAAAPPVPAVDAESIRARRPDFAAGHVDVDGAAALPDLGGAVLVDDRLRPARVVRENAVGADAPSQDVAVRDGDPDVAEAFVIGVDASGAAARQRREEIAVFRPELAKLRPRGHDAAGGDGVALHGDDDVAAGRGAGIFGPDGVGVDAPRPDDRPHPAVPVALALDDVDDHRALGAAGSPVLEDVGALLEGPDAVGVAAAPRRQRQIAEIDRDPARAAGVLGVDAMGFPSRR